MRIYLAAVSQLYSNGGKNWPMAEGPAHLHRVLLSYHPGFKNNEKLQIALQRADEPIDYCVDSGAHIWLASYFKHNKKAPIAEVEATLARFIASIRAMPRKPSFVVELDLQRIYGMDVVDAWRRDLWQPFERETGIPVCYVWHRVDGTPKWRSMLEDSGINYLGLSGDRSIGTEIRAALVLEAYKAGKPVHGFASVDTSWMKKVPFYSVDSTSWAVGAQVFGLAPTFDPVAGKIRQVHVGNREFKHAPRKAAANLMKARNFYASDILEKKDGKKNYPRFFGAAGDVFRKLEEWHTAWWVSKGLDWEAQLRRHNNVIGGSRGGHVQAPRV